MKNTISNILTVVGLIAVIASMFVLNGLYSLGVEDMAVGALISFGLLAVARMLWDKTFELDESEEDETEEDRL